MPPSVYDLRRQAAEKLGFSGDMQLSPLARSLIDAEVEGLQSAAVPTAAAQDEGGGVADWLLEASKGFQMATQMAPNLANFAGNLVMDDFNQTAVGQATQAASSFFERGVQSATDLQSQGFRDKMAAPIYDDATGEWNAPSTTQVFGTILTALPQIPAYVVGAGAVGAAGNAARLAPRVYKLSKLAGMGSATSLKLARALPGMASYGVAGGAFGGADTFAESYGSVMEKLDEYDIPEGQKDRVASKLATEAGLRQLPVAALMNAVGLGGAAQTTGALWKRIASGAMSEIPSEAIEEGAQGLNVNLSTRKLDPSFDMWTGVRTRAALGAIAGGVMGGGVAALDGNPARQRQIAELRADLDASPDAILSGEHQSAMPEALPAPAQNTSVPRLAPPIPGRSPEAQQAWDVAEVAVSIAADSTDALEQAIPNWSRMDNKAKAKIIDAVIDADGEGHTEKGVLVQKWAEHQAAAVAAVQQAHSLDDPTYGKKAAAGNELVGGAEAIAPVAGSGPAAGPADAGLDAAGGLPGAEALAPAVRADVLPAGAATDLQPALTVDGQARPAPRNSNSRAVNAERDDLLVAVAKMGGFSRQEAKSQGVDPADFRRRAGFGGVVFPKNGGLSFDAMAERLSELGYPVTDAQGNYNPNVLLDKLLGALGGKKVRTPQGDAYAMQLDDQRRAVAMSKNSALPPSEAGPEFTPAQSAVGALFADAIQAGYSYGQLDALLTDKDSLAEIHRKLSALLTGDNPDVQPEGNRDGSRQSDPEKAEQEDDLPGFDQPGEDLSDLSDDEVDRLFRGDRAADIRAARPAAGFSLSAQTEEDIRAKEARERDAAAAEAGERQRQVDATRDAFTLSTGTATAGPQAKPAVSGGQQGLSFREERANAVAAREADTAGRRDNYHDEPTDAQKEAGNYKKEKVKWNGLDLSIESQAGTMRRGTDPDGKAWEVQLQYDYGYVRGTEGADGDHVDVYLGPNLTGDRVFIVNQNHADGKFDEHKVMLGFDTLTAAKEGYLSNYEQGWDRIKDVVELSAEQFKAWLADGDTKKPATAPAAVTSEAPAATSRAKADTSGAASTKGEDAGARSSGERIEDFGEKIGGAKKDLWSSYSTSLKDALPDDIKDFTLSKHFPEPNYEKMIEAGASVEAMAAIRAMRDQMPAKPRQSWKLRMWADSLVMMRDVASQILDGKISMAELRSKLQGASRDMSSFVDKIDIYAGLGFPAFMKANGADLRWGTHFTYDGDQRTDYPNQYGVFVNGRRVVDRFFKEKKDAIEALREHLDAVEASEKAPRETKLDLYRVTATGKVMIGKKIGTNRFIDLKQFDTATEARAYLQENNAELIAQLQKFREDQNNVPTRRSTNDPRRGEDYRKGEDIAPQQFGEAFGFRGVEFGNWVEQGRRKADLNNAYDALMDMAKTVGIPPKAVSLNGSLGLAFGARGNAGAAAHFEPGKVVINLTKKEGAGSLGHEWFHAMDNYFSRQRGKDADFVTAKPHELKETGLRPEVIAAFGSLMKVINSSPMAKRSIALDKKRPKDYWSMPEELGARAFESYLIAKGKQRGDANDYLANLIDTDTAKVVFESGSSEWPYPFDGEIEPIVEAFDKLFETIQTKETDKGVAMYRRKEQTESPAFKKWFGDSKVVGADGNPLVVYHGTAKDFDAFDNSKTGANDLGLWGRGHYFSSTPVSANSYALRQGDGARVIAAYVSIQNPLVLRTGDDLVTRLPDGTNTRDLIGQNLDGSKIKAIALEGGHDGVIQMKPDGLIGDIVAFRPAQIKSVNNSGTFDSSDPSIMNKRGAMPPALVSVADAEATLRQDKFVARLLDAGRIVLHENGNSLPGPGPDKGGILGVAMPDGVIHLNAGAHDTTSGLMPTLLHEAFHARVQPLIGEKGWSKLMQSLDGIYEAGQKGDARINAFFKQALDQVESDAVGQDKLTREQKVEELGAYAIDHYDTAPKSLRMWVDMLLAKVKAWALRYFGAQLGKVSPAQLRELAKMAIRDTRYDAYRGALQPALSRQADEPANELTVAWKMLATDSDLFKLPKSTAAELADIFAEIDSGIRVTESDQEAKRARQETSKRVDRAFVVAMPRKKGEDTVYDKVYVYQAGREVWINAATLKEGVSGGFKVYAAVGNYAFNTGRVFIGDPLGLSDMALLRRTEHMLSLALKFGTTNFMMPHQKQIAPATDSTSKLKGKVRPLDWRVGADEHNLVELVRSAYTNILPFAPEIRNVDFDAVSGRFLHADSRKPVTDEQWAEYTGRYHTRLRDAGIALAPANSGGAANQSRPGSSGNASAGSVGRANAGAASGDGRGAGAPAEGDSPRSATLKRAAFAHSFLRRTSSAERRGLLAFLSGKLQGGIDGLAGVENTDLDEVFYRRAKAAPGNAPATPAAGTFDAAKDYASNIKDQFVYNYQDRFIDLRRLQDRMGKLPEQQDASLAETRYSGTVMARTQGFQQGERDPLIKAIHAAKLSYEEVEDYLNAKDAPYRNAAMKEINPTQQELDAKRAALEATIAQGFATPAVKDYLAARREVRRYEDEVDEGLADASALFQPKQRLAKLKKDPAVAAYAKATEELAVVRKTKAFDGDNTALSGLSDKDAAAIIDKAKKDGKFASLEKLSKMVDDITTGTRQLLVDSGLSKAEEVAVWAAKYPHYVPRHREEVGGDTPVVGTGRGFNIRGKESKRATGSQRKVVDILAHIMAQRETAIIRAEKVKVDRALYEMLKANPDPSVAVLDSIGKVPVVDEATGAVVDRVDPLYKNRPNVLTFKMDGEERTIEFNDENPEMVRLAVSMKNMDAQQLGAVTSMVGRFTRFLATMNTTANPVFIARNFMRDLQSAYVNLTDTELATMKKDVFRDIPAAIRGFWRMNDGKQDTEFAKFAQEFRDAGGQTGWMEHTQVIGDRAKAMQKQLAGMTPSKWSMTKETASKLWQLVEDANNAVENGIRLAAYANARRSGMTAGKAAALAKNLTVNFNRRGAKSVELNMWYMFMNASIQGTARILKAASNKDVQKILGYIVASGFLLDMLARALAGDDDDDGENDYDQLPEYVKASNWVFWIGGRPITIPQPYGYNFVTTAGRKISESMFRENFSPLTGAADLANAFVGAFSPIGQAGSLLQAVAPTVADPFVQWAENKNFAGNPLYKEQLPYGVPKPEYQMGFRSTSESSKWLAEALNMATGGNEVRPGAININPASIDFAVSSLVGGFGRTYLQAFNLPIKVLAGDEVEAREVPFLNIFGSAKPESQIEGRFFENLRSVEMSAREAKEYAGTPEGAEYRKKNAGELSLAARGKMVSASLRLLREKEKAVGLTKEQKKALEKRKQELMAGFNKAYMERVQ